MTTLLQIRTHHFNRATKTQASSKWHTEMAAAANSEHNRKYHLRNATVAQGQADWHSEAVQVLDAVLGAAA